MAAADAAVSELVESTYHIRRPLRPARGNQWYRDKDYGSRYTGTYCGAGAGMQDVAALDRAVAWLNESTAVLWVPCSACVRARAEAQLAASRAKRVAARLAAAERWLLTGVRPEVQP